MSTLTELGIEAHSVMTPRSQTSSQLLGSSQLSAKDAFFYKAEAKSLSKINNMLEVLGLFILSIIHHTSHLLIGLITVLFWPGNYLCNSRDHYQNCHGKSFMVLCSLHPLLQEN